jgi:hypothetical protein
MKIWAALAATALLTGTAHAADAPSLSAKGDGNWEMLCHVVSNGETKPTILGPDRPAYADARLTRGECAYHATAKGDLTVSLVGAGACPFAGAAADACTLTVPKGKRGSFKFRVGTAR